MMSTLPPAERRLSAEESLVWFICHAWPILEPGTTYRPNWHIDCIAEYLTAVSNGQITRLLINQPPRSLKSTLVTICWPVWCWIKRPELRWMFASYSQSLSTTHSLQRRLLLQSDWYLRNWPHVRLSHDQNMKTEFINTRRGTMIATSVGGTSIGKGGDILVFDDPLNPTEAASAAMRRTANDWMRQAFLTRLNDPKAGRIVGVMQRLHEQDTAGMLLAQGGWEHLCLPAEAEERMVVHFPVSHREIVRRPTDILFPEREGIVELARKKIELGSYGYAGQYQQQPSPSEGGLLKRHWWRFWYAPLRGSEKGEENRMKSDERRVKGESVSFHTAAPAPVEVRLEDGTLFTCPQVELPEYLLDYLQSWDMAFKETESSDFVVGQVWGIATLKGGERRVKGEGSSFSPGADKFLLDQVRARMDFPQSLAAVREMSERYPRAYTVLIEDKANGAAVVSTLRREISGVIAVNPEGGKEARVNAVAAGIEAGNVYLPHPAHCRWVRDLIEECAAFPNAAHDDQVDAMSQALLRYIQHPYRTVGVAVGPPNAELLAYRPR